MSLCLKEMNLILNRCYAIVTVFTFVGRVIIKFKSFLKLIVFVHLSGEYALMI